MLFACFIALSIVAVLLGSIIISNYSEAWSLATLIGGAGAVVGIVIGHLI